MATAPPDVVPKIAAATRSASEASGTEPADSEQEEEPKRLSQSSQLDLQLVHQASLGTIRKQLEQLPAASPLVVELLSFGDAPGVELRGSSVPSLLRRGARIFSSSAGSEATFGASRRRARLGYFISHNWAVPRWQKYLALIWHLNLVPAALAGLIALLVGVALTSAGAFPVVVDLYHSHDRGTACRVLCIPSMLCTLFWYRDLQHALGFEGPSAFLDKTCIHQSDLEKQRLGIKKLGAYVNASDVMVILYTDLYLQKLWTAYELATAIILKETRELHVVPIILPVVLIIGLFVLYVTSLLAILLATRGVRFGMMIGSCIPCAALVFAFRKWARDLESMQERLARFRCEDLLCTCEEDRPLVYSNISELMKAAGLARSGASERTALRSFELMVQRLLPGALSASIGQVGLSYSMSVILGAALIVPWYLDNIAASPLSRITAVLALQTFIYIMSIIPLAFAIWMLMARRCLQLHGCKEYAYVTTFWTAGLLATAALVVLLQALVAKAAESNLWLVVLVLAAFTSTAVTVAVYGRSCVGARAARSPENFSELEEECN